MAQVTTYIMPDRNGASNFIRDSIEISALERYIREKRKAGLPGFGITEAIMAAYVRCIARYPGCNRFLSGQKVYARGNDIQVCMVASKRGSSPPPGPAADFAMTPSSGCRSRISSRRCPAWRREIIPCNDLGV